MRRALGEWCGELLSIGCYWANVRISGAEAVVRAPGPEWIWWWDTGFGVRFGLVALYVLLEWGRGFPGVGIRRVVVTAGVK
ncbi:hypothetical protein GCM10022222_12630 [Amycolatopsis ultiminotia]|uniref:Uncharacterized protein n=1 Tax=Amycolatopsis ultiminotia TaxID=543629 RepID=A0ABP6VBW0_9PSEU